MAPAQRAPSAHAAPATGPYRVDLHAHFLPPEYRAAVLGAGLLAPGGLPLPQWTPDAALEFMDRFGIDAQVLSISDPSVRFAEPVQAARLSRYCNEYAADLIARHPTRFGGLGTVPLPDVSAAVAEAVYALDVLKLDGVTLLSSYDGVYLGDPRFDPLLAALDDRGALVFVHPGEPPAASRSTLPLPDFLLEFPFETTRAVTTMITAGVPIRYPNLRILLAHAGGCTPFLATRLGSPRIVVPDVVPDVSLLGVADALRTFYYDTALSASASSMRSVLEVADRDHVVFGTDWPFSGLTYARSETDDPAPGLDAVFDADERYLVERSTPLSLVPRLARLLE